MHKGRDGSPSRPSLAEPSAPKCTNAYDYEFPAKASFHGTELRPITNRFKFPVDS